MHGVCQTDFQEGTGVRNRVFLIVVWRVGCVVCLASPVAARAERPSPQVARPTSSTRPALRIDSPGRFVVDQILSPLGRSPSLLTSRLNLPRRPRVSRSSVPLRQFTLLGGDRFLAEILRWEDNEIELRLRSGQTVRVPRAVVAGVSVPNGETELLYESFEPAAAGAVTSLVERPSIDAKWLDADCSAGGLASLNMARVPEPVVYNVTGLPEASRVQFWFRIDEPAGAKSEVQTKDSADELKAHATGLRVDFDFQTDDAESRWSLSTASDSASMSVRGRADDSATKQAVTLSHGWHCLTAAFLGDHAVCVVDDALLVSAVRSAGRLRSIRFAATGPVWIDDLQISRVQIATEGSPVRPSTQDDCIALHNGDRLFGRVAQGTSAGVALTGPAGDRLVAWHTVHHVALRQPDRAAAGRSPSVGLWAAIEFQPSLDRPQQPSDRIMATIIDVDRNVVVVAHPWLGNFAIAWNQVARVEPQFIGQCLTVDARTLHLGNAIRDDFQRPIPDGTEWSGQFDVPPMSLTPNAEAWLSLDAVDLEPSGPLTPPASPFLKELRLGRLLTELTINDQRAGDLNRWIRFRATPDHPERLRCRLPADSLRTGRNVFRLRQIPLKESGTSVDNCELSNLRIEIVEPVAER